MQAVSILDVKNPVILTDRIGPVGTVFLSAVIINLRWEIGWCSYASACYSPST